MREDKKRLSMRLAAAIFILLLFSAAISGGLFSRYISQDSSGGGDTSVSSGRAAAYVFHVDDDIWKILDLQDIKKPGDEMTFSFAVSAAENGHVSETAQSFAIEADFLGSLPLKGSISDDEGAAIELDNKTEASARSGDYDIPAGDAYDRQFTVKIWWPEEENDAAYSQGGAASLRIKISSWQTD